MIFKQTELLGVFEVHAEPQEDERGAFARMFCREEFARSDIEFETLQTNLSTNSKAETLRGLHFQKAPHGEAKLVQVLSGAVYDVVVDMRPGIGFGKWISRELSRANGIGLYLPKGVAHGFLTLTDDTNVLYHMGSLYVADSAAGVAWDDPDLNISWPRSPQIISARDLAFPKLADIDRALIA